MHRKVLLQRKETYYTPSLPVTREESPVGRAAATSTSGGGAAGTGTPGLATTPAAESRAAKSRQLAQVISASPAAFRANNPSSRASTARLG